MKHKAGTNSVRTNTNHTDIRTLLCTEPLPYLFSQTESCSRPCRLSRFLRKLVTMEFHRNQLQRSQLEMVPLEHATDEYGTQW